MLGYVRRAMVQGTLRGFHKETPITNWLAMNIDRNLCLATLFVLVPSTNGFGPGTIISLDDFYSISHECKTFCHHDIQFGSVRRSEKSPYCIKAIEIES